MTDMSDKDQLGPAALVLGHAIVGVVAFLLGAALIKEFKIKSVGPEAGILVGMLGVIGHAALDAPVSQALADEFGL
jgi:hypothetical protein